MKKNIPAHSSIPLRHTRNQNGNITPPKVHQRGDKVVVNGAKQSLLSILRRYNCQCRKHTADKLILKFLSLNKITASYDVLVWMLIYLKMNFEPHLYTSIVNEYLVKMQKKNSQNESHLSQKYKITKKKALQKFIQSAQFFVSDHIDEITVEKSVNALYSKGKSRDNALTKIKVFLSKIKLQDQLAFQQSSCSFKQDHSYQSLKMQRQQQNRQKMTSENSEGKIYEQDPQQENPIEETPLEMLEDYQSMSQWASPNKETYDLFQELIQAQKSDQSLRSSY